MLAYVLGSGLFVAALYTVAIAEHVQKLKLKVACILYDSFMATTFESMENYFCNESVANTHLFI